MIFSAYRLIKVFILIIINPLVSSFQITGAIILNILSILLTMIAVILTVAELFTFHSLSYRNYGQAKLGREVSRVLLLSYPLEFVVAVSYSILTCSDLGRDSEDNFTTVTDEAERGF
uniref:Membrane spanning 4-domains A13 n=1 Tax=Molossus molossus TaxID=27622 RepID=A0A7J8ES20_MOLMO|nr:membrane spanning 4-domains A13 [Molossus molossus]